MCQQRDQAAVVAGVLEGGLRRRYRGAVDAYWNWQTSRAGNVPADESGYPRFKRKGRDADRVCFTTGAMRVEPDRRHLTLPVIGCVRTHENTRRIERLIAKG